MDERQLFPSVRKQAISRTLSSSHPLALSSGYPGSLWIGEIPEVETRYQFAQCLKGGWRFLPHRSDVGIRAVLGITPVSTLSTDLVIGAVPPERAGVASGLSETSSELGGALGIALLGSIATALYRHTISSSIPHVVSYQASQLPRASGLALITSARAAFVDASMLIFSLCVGIALLTALAAVVLLRGITGGTSPDQQSEPVPYDGVKESVA